MRNNYNYQEWQMNLGAVYTCSNFAHIIAIEQPLRPSVKVFLYIINLFINENMYYENRLQKKS